MDDATGEWIRRLAAETLGIPTSPYRFATSIGAYWRNRYDGLDKAYGPQYVRGIIPGNGVPPGNAFWVTYSMNKEDMWVSRVPVPVKYKVDGPVNDNFNTLETHGAVTGWNIYSQINGKLAGCFNSFV